jgi:soluble lytic murein transglycosylase-like protein
VRWTYWLVGLALGVVLLSPALARADDRPTAKWRALIERAADEFDVDADLIEAIVLVESNGDQNARSSAGAIGLGQLLPQTARAHGVDPYDAADNLRGTAAHLAYWLARCGYVNGIAAYNGGTRACAGKYLPETAAYVPRVIAMRGQISAEPRRVYLPGLPKAGEGGNHGQSR